MRFRTFRKKNYYRTINRDRSHKVPFGYCHIDRHKGYITLKQAQRHKCLKKNCPFLTLNTEHYANQKDYQKYLKEKGIDKVGK